MSGGAGGDVASLHDSRVWRVCSSSGSLGSLASLAAEPSERAGFHPDRRAVSAAALDADAGPGGDAPTRSPDGGDDARGGRPPRAVPR